MIPTIACPLLNNERRCDKCKKIIGIKSHIIFLINISIIIKILNNEK